MSSTYGLASDFSLIASRYDASRDIPEQKLSVCYDRLIERGLFPAHGTVLDAGCGTGQISLPLARRGYRVQGFDISSEMVKLAQSKIRPEWLGCYGVADIRNIPAGDGSFDAVVVSKLFMHIEDWQKARELIRVVRRNSYIVHIKDRGMFGNSVRAYFSKRTDELGFTGRFLGVNPNSGAELTNFMASLGCDLVQVDMSDVRWDFQISFGEAIRGFRDRLFAEFWYLPIDIYDRVLAETIGWVESQPSGMDTVEHLCPYLSVEASRTPAQA